MAVTRIGDLLDGALNRTGSPEIVRAAQILEMATSVLVRLFGADIGRHLRAASFRHGTLTVESASPEATSELRLRQPEILTSLHTAMPRVQFERIVVIPRFSERPQ